MGKTFAMGNHGLGLSKRERKRLRRQKRREARDTGVKIWDEKQRKWVPYSIKDKAKKYVPWWGDSINILVSPHAYKKMLCYTRLANGEISGFGKLTRNGNTMTVNDVRIFEQECCSGGTHLQEDALSKFLVDLIQSKQDPNEWKLWWHTHCDFSVFWSGTDVATAKQLSKNDWAVSICINKSAHMIARIDEKGRTASLKVELDVLPSQKIQDQCKKEVDALVKPIKFLPLKRRDGRKRKKLDLENPYQHDWYNDYQDTFQGYDPALDPWSDRYRPRGFGFC